MATWRELKAQGIHRCSVIYSSGEQCRRRASKAFNDSWCDKHGPIMKMHTDHANAAMTAEKEGTQ